MSKLSVKLKEKYDDWMAMDPFVHSRKELKNLFENSGNDEVLKKRLEKRIDFGTAGLRSEMAAGWSCMNDLIIVQTTQGLVRYVEKLGIEKCKTRGVLIGFDHRKNGPYTSKRFCELTAAVFLHSGWKVYMFKDIVPTPFVPYGILKLDCACGIMMTASHNPKADNGYKLYWSNGCQIIRPHDKGIQEMILKPENQKLWGGMDITNEKFTEEVWKRIEDPMDDIVKGYFSEITKFQFRSKERNEATKTKLVYTAMHGTGAPWVAKALKTFNLPKYEATPSQQEPDPNFPTASFPNPEEDGTLKNAMEVAMKVGSSVVIANDPDADRLAVAELQKDGKTWKKFNGNEIAILLASWVWENYSRVYKPDPKKCVMINSTVSSKVLEGLALYHGFKFDETLTGFKWIGNKGWSYKTKENFTFLFGYEVEIGFVVGDMSFDKDGVRVAPIFYEMMDWVYTDQKQNLVERLNSVYEKIGYYNMKTKYFFADTPEKMNVVYENLRKSRKNPEYPETCGKFKVKYVRDLTVGYDNSKKDNKPVLPVTATDQMITFTFEDSSVCTLRNSGTEPKIKWYVECKAPSPEEANKKALELSNSVIHEFIQPKKFGLKIPYEGWKLE